MRNSRVKWRKVLSERNAERRLKQLRMGSESPDVLGDCVYCGRPGRTRDHVIPKSKGGTNAPWNLVPACRDCNSFKSARSLRPLGWTIPAQIATNDNMKVQLTPDQARLQQIKAAGQWMANTTKNTQYLVKLHTGDLCVLSGELISRYPAQREVVAIISPRAA